MEWTILTNVVAGVACFGLAVMILGWAPALFMGLLHQVAVCRGDEEDEP